MSHLQGTCEQCSFNLTDKKTWGLQIKIIMRKVKEICHAKDENE